MARTHRARKRKQRDETRGAAGGGANASRSNETTSALMMTNTGDRNAQSSRAVYERMTKDRNFSRLRDDEIEQARRAIEEKLSITDETTGERRAADLKNEDDLRRLTEEANVYVLTDPSKAGGAGDGRPSDMKRGFVRLNPATLPSDLNPHRLLPVYQAILADEFSVHRNSADDIFMWMPLVNVPVYTSTLLMLLTGEPVSPTSDSFSVMRVYNVVVRFLANVDFTRSRLRTCLAWLRTRLRSGRLPKRARQQFAAHAVVAVSLRHPVADRLRRWIKLLRKRIR